MSVDPPNKSFLNIVDYSKFSNWSAASVVLSQELYRDGLPLEKIGNIIQRYKERVEIQDGVEYTRVTIRNKNRGVVPRDTAFGDEIGTKTQYKIKAGQFIMSKIDARNGAFGIVPEELENAVVTQDFISFTIDEEQILPQFFVLITTSKQFMQLCQQASSGTTGRQRINETIFLDFEIPLPDLEVQRALVRDYEEKMREAEKLEEDVDYWKKLTKQSLEKRLGLRKYEEEQKNNNFQFLNFSQIEEWGINSPQSKLKSLFIDFNYEALKIGHICQIGSGGTPSRNIPSYYNGSIPWVKTGEVRENIISSTEEKITDEGLNHSSAKIYPKGSLIVAMYGATAGRSAKLGIDSSTNQACAVLYDIDNTIILTDYLWIYLKSQIKNFQLIATGSAQPNLNAKKIFDYQVPIPSLEEQKEIIKIMTEGEKLITQKTQNRDFLKKQALENFNNAIFKN